MGSIVLCLINVSVEVIIDQGKQKRFQSNPSTMISVVSYLTKIISMTLIIYEARYSSFDDAIDNLTDVQFNVMLCSTKKTINHSFPNLLLLTVSGLQFQHFFDVSLGWNVIVVMIIALSTILESLGATDAETLLLCRLFIQTTYYRFNAVNCKMSSSGASWMTAI